MAGKCRFNNPEELNNLVNNHEALFEIQKNQTQDTTVGYLRQAATNFSKIDGRYQASGGARLATTITTKIDEDLGRTSTFVETEKSRKEYKFRADVGSFIHGLNEVILTSLISKMEGMTTPQAIEFLANQTWDSNSASVIADMVAVNREFPHLKIVERFNAQSGRNLENLFNGARDILSQVYTRQKYINKRTGGDGVPQILVEQIMIDAVKDIGGTADLVAIYSDNTASVFDFKTKIPKEGKFGVTDANGDVITDKFITYHNKEKYKLQLAAIQRILVQRFGVKQVVQSRIVPIQVNVAKNDQFEFNGTITKIGYGAKQNPFLAQLALLPELTGYKDLDEFLVGIDKKIKTYEAKSKTDRANSEYYRNKISELDRAKQSVLVRHSLNELIGYTKNVLDQSEPEKLATLTLEQLREIKDELRAISLIDGATYDYREALGESESEAAKTAKENFETEIKNIYLRVNDRLHEVEQELYNKRLSATINELTGYDITDELGQFISFADEGFFGKYFNQLSHFENPVFKALRAKLDDAQFNIRKSVNAVIAEVQEKDDALQKWMRENGKDQQWLINSLIDTNPDSRNADNLYDKLSPEFRKRVAKLRADKDAAGLVEIYEPSTGYEAWFKKASAEKKAYYDRIYEDKKTATRNYEFWAQKNDLSLEGGKPKYPGAWLNNLNSGRLVYRKGVQEKNYSEEFKYIQSIPVLAAYYEMFEKHNKKFRGLLGVEFFKLPNNFLPNVRKSNIDRLVDMGVFDGGKSMIDNILSDLNIREDDQMFGEIDPETGGLKKTIPRFYLNSFKTKDGKVAIGEKSYDLSKSLILFAKMAYNYETMNQIEGTVLTMRDFLSEKATQVIKRGGQPLRDYVGNELASKIQGKDIDQIFQSFVDLYIYGVSVNPISDNSSGKYEKLILKAKQYFTLKALGLGFIPSAGSFLAAKTQAAIEGFKGQIYTSEQYREAMKDGYTNREKFLALSGFFDVMDVKYDFFSIGTDRTKLGDPRERNWVKKYVNSRFLLRTFSLGDEYLDEVILAAMSKNYYLDENNDLRPMRNDADRQTHQARSIWNLFNYDGNKGSITGLSEKDTEKVIKKVKAAAQAAQSRIKGVIPAEDKAYWQTQLIGQVVMHFKSWMPALIKERWGKVRYNDPLMMVEMGRFTAFGQELINPEQLAVPEYMKSILLPKLVHLIKALIPFMKFKSTRQRLAYETWIENNPQYRNKISFEEFVDAQEKQIKTLILELRLLLAFAILMMLLSADFDDDGKKFYQEMWLTRKLVAILSKTESEISFTYNPKEFANMIKNPIPMAGVLTDAVNVIANSYDETLDLAFGEKFPFPGHKPQSKDKAGVGYYTLKIVPGVNQLDKFLEIMSGNTDPLNR